MPVRARLARRQGRAVSRVWVSAPPPPEPEPPPADAPRSTVPKPAHIRVREELIEIYGLDDDCSDDTVILTARMYASAVCTVCGAPR